MHRDQQQTYAAVSRKYFYSALLSTSALDYAPHRPERPEARCGTSKNPFPFDAAEVSMSEALRIIAAAWL